MTSDDNVLILMATYNGASYLREQLNSIASQVHSLWELVVADDGSSDDTLAVLGEFSRQYPGRVNLLDLGPSGSPAANFFRLLRSVSKGGYVAFCDQDDVWAETKLSRLIEACQTVEHEHGAHAPALVFSDLRVVDHDLTLLAPSFFNQIAVNPATLSLGSTLVENAVPGCAMLFNGAMVQVFQQFHGDLTDARMHDWWISLLAHSFGNVKGVPEALVSYRQHSRNAAGTVRRRSIRFALNKLLQLGSRETSRNVSQARLLLDAYGGTLPELAFVTVEAFSNILTLSKLARVKTCVRLGILKQGVARRAYQLLRI